MIKRLLFSVLIIMSIFVFTCPVTAETGPRSGGQARQQEPPLGLQILDVVLVRPVCVIGSAVSTAAYLLISPLTYLMGLGEPVARAMVEAPWRFTASRYVGQFDHYTDEKPIKGVWQDLKP